MTEGGSGWTENFSRRFWRVLHEAGRKPGRNLQDAIDAGGQRRCHQADGVRHEIALTVHFAVICEHSIELRQRRSAADSGERDDLEPTILGVVHSCNGMKSCWRCERLPDQSSWGGE